MHNIKSEIKGNKVIIRLQTQICEISDELIESSLFREILKSFIVKIEKRESKLLNIFGKKGYSKEQISILIETIKYLFKLEADLVVNVVPGSNSFLDDRKLLFDFIENLYTHWRTFDRFIICDSEGIHLDKTPYRTFNRTVEQLMHLVRQVYRNVQENLSGKHPKVYRQVHAGSEVATIALPKQIPGLDGEYEKLNDIGIIRQILLYPPLIYDPPMNKRRGMFKEIKINPLEKIDINAKEWLCYPAKVCDVLIHVYFHETFYELGFGLCNLFELAEEEDLEKQPDAIYLYGAPEGSLDGLAEFNTVYYKDKEKNMLVGAVPRDDEFGYFGYLKKMILTLHNIKKIEQNIMPYHGAFYQISLKGNKKVKVLMIGDSGAGKSESLEALRFLGSEKIRDLTIIADDMGSIIIEDDGTIRGLGTETGAFLRLDDLQTGYAFEQLDRAIITNPSKVNARIVIPITDFETITEGREIDYILYANNYEEVDEEHKIIESFDNAEDALKVFREGAVMSKGTTNTTGLVHSYFANVFGPPQNREAHDKIVDRYFQEFFKKGIFVGQIRTRLGVKGMENDGPIEAAKALLSIIEK